MPLNEVVLDLPSDQYCAVVADAVAPPPGPATTGAGGAEWPGVHYRCDPQSVSLSVPDRSPGEHCGPPLFRPRFAPFVVPFRWLATKERWAEGLDASSSRLRRSLGQEEERRPRRGWAHSEPPALAASGEPCLRDVAAGQLRFHGIAKDR